MYSQPQATTPFNEEALHQRQPASPPSQSITLLSKNEQKKDQKKLQHCICTHVYACKPHLQMPHCTLQTDRLPSKLESLNAQEAMSKYSKECIFFPLEAHNPALYINLKTKL